MGGVHPASWIAPGAKGHGADILPLAAPKEKKKRITKQRQSLAEKERGTTIFPMARIKRIIKADKELDMMSNEACFMIAVATVRSLALTSTESILSSP